MTDLDVSPFTLHPAYRLSQPITRAQFKQQPEDFIVIEELGYPPSGDGEHFYFWIEKRNLNTAFVAEQLAKVCGVPLRQVTYAGRKDKFALTRQWFGVHAPKGLSNSLEDEFINGARILERHKHNKKLRVGQLKGNRFEIVLRNVSDADEVDARLRQVNQQGAPNYFGPQRFGVMHSKEGEVTHGGTLHLALRMLKGEVIRNRNKRNLAISALRSAFFNAQISERILRKEFDCVKQGDVCQLTGSNSYFVEEGDTIDATQQRYESNDLSIAAALPGDPTQRVPYLSDAQQALIDELAALKLDTQYRPIKLSPDAFEWQKQRDTLSMQFSLPSGCFATSLLRECVNLDNSIDSGNE